ncbi:MAG: hypothetical protein DRN07_06625 [Thermoplasmata archaeon]|nr:MAG: hypothetical protein DRN07_06625 [Thermoplasmata archaeon]
MFIICDEFILWGDEMKNNTMKKGFAVGVIALFLCLSVTSVYGAESSVKSRESSGAMQEAVVEIEVDEYRADGSINTVIVPLTQDEVNNLKEDLLSAKTADERFAIFKEYGLIPEEKTMEELKNDMYARAEAMGLTREKVAQLASRFEPIVKQRPPILLDFFSRVNTVYMGGGTVRVGLSALIGYLNFLRGWNLPKADFFDVSWGLLGVVDSSGLIVQHQLVTFPGIMCLVGFVGYNIKLPLFLNGFWGYSAVTFGAGLGFHTVIWFYWLNRPPPE